MRLHFEFTHLCGSIYSRGNLLFSPNGHQVFSPVGNRCSVFDLQHHQSYTFPFQNKRHIVKTAISPNGQLLFTIDEEGHALLSSVTTRQVLHAIHFKAPVSELQFSPDGRFFLVALENPHFTVQLWRVPSADRQFMPFQKVRTFVGHHQKIVSIRWHPTSKFFLTASQDRTAKLYTTHPTAGFVPITFAAHRASLLTAAFLSAKDHTIMTLSADGALHIWALTEAGNGYRLVKKHYLLTQQQQTQPGTTDGTRAKYQRETVMSADVNVEKQLLLVGSSAGVFRLFMLQSVLHQAIEQVQTLSISQHKIDTCCISPDGAWLTFGASELGQLLVWEWSSESYIMKQQSHSQSLNAISYAPDGSLIATGGEDGKVKVWNTTSGFCFVTFAEHDAAVNAVQFASRGQALFSASTDGTVRAFDLLRYRNFRTFATPEPVQLHSLALDASGELVAAGSQDTFEIFVWSVQTGKLLDILAGHEGPISSLSFFHCASGSHDETLALVSGSWDKTARIWNVYGRGNANKMMDALQHSADVLAVACRADHAEIATSSLDGSLSFWEPKEGSLLAVIDGKRDVQMGRAVGDKIAAKTANQSAYFNSICYSTDMTTLIAGGLSRFICIYSVASRCLIKRFAITENVSLDGMQQFLSTKKYTEAGDLRLIDTEEAEEGAKSKNAVTLPGVQKGDLAERKTMPRVRTNAVSFSPDGQHWAAASTEGLLMYSLKGQTQFDPFGLDVDVTPQSCIDLVNQDKRWTEALVMAFRLNDAALVKFVYHAIPRADVPLVVGALPTLYLPALMRHLSDFLDEADATAVEGHAMTSTPTAVTQSAAAKGNVNPHLALHLHWVIAVGRSHGAYIRDHFNEHEAPWRGLRKTLAFWANALTKMYFSFL